MKIALIKRNGKDLWYSRKFMKGLIRESANRILAEISEEELTVIEREFSLKIKALNMRKVPYTEWRNCLSEVMRAYPEILNSFLSTHKDEDAKCYAEICAEMNTIVKNGDKSNGSVDSSLSSSKRALIVDAVEKVTYRNYHLTDEQKAHTIPVTYIYMIWDIAGMV